MTRTLFCKLSYMIEKISPKFNLTAKEKLQAFNEVKACQEINKQYCYRKRGAVIFQEAKDFIQEANWQLNSKVYYGEVRHPTATHSKLIDQTIDRFKRQRLLKEKVADGLKVKNPAMT